MEDADDALYVRNPVRIIDLTTQPSDVSPGHRSSTQSKTAQPILGRYSEIFTRKATLKHIEQPDPPAVRPAIKPKPAKSVGEIKRRRQREKAQRSRYRRKKARQDRVGMCNGATLFDHLMRNIVLAGGGNRNYSITLLDLVSRVGSAPPAAGARSPLAVIIKHVTGSNCACVCVSLGGGTSSRYQFS